MSSIEPGKSLVEKAAQDFPILWKIGIPLGGLIIIFFFDLFSERDRGVVAASSFACILVLIRLKRDLLKYWWFWVFFGVVIFAHAVAVVKFAGTIEIHPTILIAPLVFADFVIMAFLLVLLERKMKVSLGRQP